MSRPRLLDLFGVIHMDDVEKVTEELDDCSADADAIFIEHPPNPGGVRRYVEVFLRAPAFLVGLMSLLLFVQGPILLALVRDLVASEYVATQRVARRRDLPVHAIDDHPVVRAQNASWKKTALNWVAVVPIVAYEPIAATVTAVAILLGALVPVLVRRLGYTTIGPLLFVGSLGAFAGIVLTGYVSGFLVLFTTLVALVQVNRGIDDRNAVMLDRVEDHATEEGYERATLVTGKGHLGGMVRDAADRELTISSVHVSFWRDVGFTYDAPLPNDLPELGRGDQTIRERIAETFREDLPRDARRFLAAGIDAVGILVVCYGLRVAIEPVVGTVDGVGSDLVPLAAWGGIWVAVVVGYHATLEGFLGTTPGKRVTALELTSTDGGEVSKREALVRNLLRPVDLLAVYVPSLVTVSNTVRAQSVGDLLAGTRVQWRHAEGDRVEREYLHRDPDEPPLEQYRDDDSTDEDRADTGESAVPDGVVGAQSGDASRGDAAGRSSTTDDAGRPTATGPEALPGYPRRFGAAVVDVVAAVVVWFALSVLGLLVARMVTGQPYDVYGGQVMLALWLVGPTSYYALLEGVWGTTVGKRLTGLVVVAKDGSPATFRDVVARNLLRSGDLLTLYVLSGIATLASARQRSLADLVGGTVVRRRDAVLAARAERSGDPRASAERRAGDRRNADRTTSDPRRSGDTDRADHTTDHGEDSDKSESDRRRAPSAESDSGRRSETEF